MTKELKPMNEWQKIRFGDTLKARVALQYWRVRGWSVDDRNMSQEAEARIYAFTSGWEERANHPPMDLASLHSKIDMDVEDELKIKITFDESVVIGAALKVLAAQGFLKTELSDKMRRLIIAARVVAYESDIHPADEKLRELDKAVEAFAEVVPWEEEPTDEEVKP